ncbi:MAG: hypothetical protein HDQ88_11990 [Clostridia bacterium]|nr:hypothetical protein [Clostridia bacterium]
MIAPNLQGANISPLTVNKVQFRNGREAWLVTMGVIFPSTTDVTGKVINARRLLGFRTFDHEPQNGIPLPYNDFAYYLAEVGNGAQSAAQQFLDAVTGVGQPQEQEQESDKPDAAWTDMFEENEAHQAPTVVVEDVEVVR